MPLLFPREGVRGCVWRCAVKIQIKPLIAKSIFWANTEVCPYKFE
jgi:hypothetical protein